MEPEDVWHFCLINELSWVGVICIAQNNNLPQKHGANTNFVKITQKHLPFLKKRIRHQSPPEFLRLKPLMSPIWRQDGIGDMSRMYPASRPVNVRIGSFCSQCDPDQDTWFRKWIEAQFSTVFPTYNKALFLLNTACVVFRVTAFCCFALATEENVKPALTDHFELK